MTVNESHLAIRLLDASDHEGYVELINQFRPSSRNRAMDFEAIRCEVIGSGVVWICTEGGKVVGTVTVHVEQKFIHGGARYARIEDLFVMPGWRNRGIAGMLLNRAMQYCQDPVNCIRKVSLTCTDELVSFYERRGFSNRQNDLSVLTDEFS